MEMPFSKQGRSQVPFMACACMQELAARGATVLMACRNEERGKAAVAAVVAKTGNPDVHLKARDLAPLRPGVGMASPSDARLRHADLRRV